MESEGSMEGEVGAGRSSGGRSGVDVVAGGAEEVLAGTSESTEEASLAAALASLVSALDWILKIFCHNSGDQDSQVSQVVVGEQKISSFLLHLRHLG